MNNTNKTGTLNINRLIEEAEALLLGEHPTQPTSCTDCNGCQSHSCKDNRMERAIRRPLAMMAK